MKLPRLLAIVLLSAFIPAVSSAAGTNAIPARHCAWKVQGEKCVVYLLGSVHVLKRENYPLPQVFEGAYSNASIVVFETDIGTMMKPETQFKLLTKAQLPDGQTLKDVLSEKTYAGLSAHLEKSGLPEMMFTSMRPGMAVMMLATLELQKLGYRPEDGMDLHYYGRSKKDGKTVRGLESLDFQMSLICDLSKEEGESLVKSTLKDLGDAKNQFGELMKAWKGGDNDGLEKLLNEAQKEDPALMRKLLTDRNARWVPQIEELVRGTNNAVVIVGAGHLVGKSGVVDLLKERGCKVLQE